MMKYIISCITILLTFLTIYFINLKFESRQKIPKLKEETLIKINISSDYIVVLTRKNCPYCTILEEKIQKSNKKYTNISLNMDYTYDFDDTFTNLELEERAHILEEVQKLFEPGQTLLFPTIIIKDKLYYGLPQDEILFDLFDIPIETETETDTVADTVADI